MAKVKTKTITQTGLHCLECGTKIFSESRHDMRYCKCKACFVDGGFDYFRAGYKTREGFREITRKVKVTDHD